MVEGVVIVAAAAKANTLTDLLFNQKKNVQNQDNLIAEDEMFYFE